MPSLLMTPTISGDRVVWLGSVDGVDLELVLYDIGTGTTEQLTHNDIMLILPAISGDRIVWSGMGELGREVFLGILDTSSSQPPLACEDTYTATENSTLHVSAASGILANDQDEDSEELSAILVEPPTHGTLTLNDDGSFTYLPDANFNREDSFQYVANDGTSNSNVATATITIDTPYPWHNGLNGLNVNDDAGYVSPIDALLIINTLNFVGAHKLPTDRPRPLTDPFYDVNRDTFVSPVDALLVINYLNRGGGEGEAGGTATSAKVASTWWPMAVNTETHEIGALDATAADHADSSRMCVSGQSTSILQSLDLLFAKLDEARGTGNGESVVGRRGVNGSDLQDFLESMLGGSADEELGSSGQ